MFYFSAISSRMLIKVLNIFRSSLVICSILSFHFPAMLERNCSAWYNIYAAIAFGRLSVGEVACIFQESAPLPFIFFRSSFNFLIPRLVASYNESCIKWRFKLYHRPTKFIYYEHSCTELIWTLKKEVPPDIIRGIRSSKTYP